MKIVKRGLSLELTFLICEDTDSKIKKLRVLAKTSSEEYLPIYLSKKRV